jgi:hypothetical protein
MACAYEAVEISNFPQTNAGRATGRKSLFARAFARRIFFRFQLTEGSIESCCSGRDDCRCRCFLCDLFEFRSRLAAAGADLERAKPVYRSKQRRGLCRVSSFMSWTAACS